MRRFFLLLSLLLVFSYLPGQNLVPNPSFEDTVMCPDMGGQVTRAQHWFDLSNTPDYFHSCSPVNQFSVPVNTVGFQYPNSGNAYMGMWCYSSSAPLYREIIGTFLNASLIIGQKYFINFKANCSYNFPLAGNNTACNKIGILFSTIDYISSAPPTGNFAQVYTDSIISDTLNWVTIRGSFIADSSYEFISIGNFFNNANTDTLHLANSNSYQAYLYLDDFCISDDSLFCELWTSLSESTVNENIQCFPNPFTDKLTIKNIPYDCREIEIYNINGIKLHTVYSYGKNIIKLNVSSLCKGVYTLVFRKSKSLETRKLIKI